MRGLVVEDSKPDVTLIRLALKRFAPDVEIQVAEDGVDAIDYLRCLDNPRPDFILLDLKLPRKSGLEVLAWIKREPCLRRTPVIAITSSRAADDVARAYDLQVAGYFVKPVTGIENILQQVVGFLRMALLPGPEYDLHPLGGGAGRSESVHPMAAPGTTTPWSREQLLGAIVDGAADAIIGVKLDGTIMTWNESAEVLYGHTPEEAIGSQIRHILPSREVDELVSLGGAGGASHFETTWTNRVGRKITLASIVSPIRDPQGEVVGISILAREITERSETEEKLRIAVERSPSAIVMVDAAGTIILVNTETERLFGYARSELLGKSVEILVPERYRSRHPQLRGEFLGKPETRAMGAGRDLFGLRKDGSEVPVEIGLSPIQTLEGTLILSTIVDITERKRAQEALAQRTQELARSNEELEQFAYVASHDLQEPLRTVASYTKLLSDHYDDRLDEDGRTYIHFAREAAIRMQKLIEALLALSRVGTRGRDTLAVDVGRALRQAMANLKASIDESQAEIVCGDLPIVQANPIQIVELFQNLIGNAIKFRGASSPRVEVIAQRGRSEWLFSVADNGIGIEPEFFDRIFQVFQQLHSRQKYVGTGIGLAICKRIVERMGGRLWVESTPGAGSTFFFTVPFPVMEGLSQDLHSHEETGQQGPRR